MISEITSIMCYLDATFHIMDLGSLKYFLGLEIARSPHGISVCQRKYVLDILSDTGLLASKPCSAPMTWSAALYSQFEPVFPSVSAYCRLLGRLLFLTTTRPDISYVVQQFSQFLSAPSMAHHRASQCVILIKLLVRVSSFLLFNWKPSVILIGPHPLQPAALSLVFEFF